MFIARKLISTKGKSSSLNRGTRIILGIAVGAVSISLVVMILALAIVTGFQREIREKVVGFGAHLQITEFNYENPLNFKPMDINQSFYPHIDTLPEIRTIQAYALKEGIIKTDKEIQGVIAKGVYRDFNWDFFKQNLEYGSLLNWNERKKSNDVLISKEIARKLELDTGQAITVYFVQDNKSRPRKLTVRGIYHTGMKQFDESYILVDIRHVQKLNNWSENQISGFEVLLNDFSGLSTFGDFLYHQIPPELNVSSIKDQYYEIFGWLELQDMNVIVIIILLVLVSSINVISVLLILILEKSNFIGIMKSSGAANWSLRRIFIFMGGHLILRGVFWGNVIGLSLAFIQNYFHLVTLPQESYYIEFVPVEINLVQIIALNLGTFIICFMVLIIPTSIISNISPARSIRFN